MMGQSVGPVLGGVITEFSGFRTIFWFLFGLGFITLVLIVLFLPETLRCIAGNGSVRLHGVDKPLVYLIKPQPSVLFEASDCCHPTRILTVKSIIYPLRFLFQRDVFVTLLFGAVVYAVWSMVTSSTAFLFQSRFGLTDLEVGLIFLPNGAGCVIGSICTGYLLDRDFCIVETQYRADKEIPDGSTLNLAALMDFPVAKSRLRSAWYLVILFVAAVAGYGFAIGSAARAEQLGMILPLVLQFVISYTATSLFTQNSALIVDLYPGASAGGTAVNNLIRCSIGAAGVAVVQFMIDAIGAGLTFLTLASVTLGVTPLLWAELVWGGRWRQKRMERQLRKEAEHLGADGGERAPSRRCCQSTNSRGKF